MWGGDTRAMIQRFSLSFSPRLEARRHFSLISLVLTDIAVHERPVFLPFARPPSQSMWGGDTRAMIQRSGKNEDRQSSS